MTSPKPDATQTSPAVRASKTQPHLRKPPVPLALADVALIDAPTCAAAGSVCVSWWHEKVAAGIAPEPAFRAPRCTRWRAVEVAAFWRDFTPGAQGNASAADAVKVHATKASAAAQMKRRKLPVVPTQAGA